MEKQNMAIKMRRHKPKVCFGGTEVKTVFTGDSSATENLQGTVTLL